MLDPEFYNFSLWWVIPIVMMAICFFMMRGRMGSMMCGHGSNDSEGHNTSDSDSTIDILDKRYARGEIKKEEYEEKKRVLNLDN